MALINQVSVDDLVVAVKRSPEGLMIMLKPKTRSELMLAYAELQLAITDEILRMNASRRANEKA